MATIDNGGIVFTAELDNEKLNRAVEETIRRKQGLSDETVAGGKAMDGTFEKTADDIKKSFQDIQKMMNIHVNALIELGNEYDALGTMAEVALSKGDTKNHDEFRQRQEAIEKEIEVRISLLSEVDKMALALEKEEAQFESLRKKIQQNVGTQTSLKTRIKEVKEDMVAMIEGGIDQQSEAYKRLEAELARLMTIQGDVAKQGQILSHNQAGFQGVISGLSGISGGFSAATGAISLFAGENENLQKIMLKVQSLMAITIGLQQVSQTLNKDSAFSLNILGKVKQWWAGVTTRAAIAQKIETAAKQENTVANTDNVVAETSDTASKIANTAATTAAATASKGLAGSIRLVGQAIKSIPVVGWIIAGITALIAIYTSYSNKAKETKKAQEELANKVAEGASKQVTAIKELSHRWKQLGSDMDAQKKFIRENAEEVKNLTGQVLDLNNAEDIFVNNTKTYVRALIERAKAQGKIEEANAKIKEAVAKQAEADAMPETISKFDFDDFQQLYDKIFMDKADYEKKYTFFNAERESVQREANNLMAAAQNLFDDAQLFEDNAKIMIAAASGSDLEKTLANEISGITRDIEVAQATIKNFNEKTSYADYKKQWELVDKLNKQLLEKKKEFWAASGNSNKDIDDGSRNYIKKILNDLQSQYDAATNETSRSVIGKQILYWQEELNKTELKAPKIASSDDDPFLKELEKKKKAYQDYFKLVNSGMKSEADSEFPTLLKNGETYLDYLKRLKQELLGGNGELDAIGAKMVEVFGTGNVNLLTRPMIDAFDLVTAGWEGAAKKAGKSIATLYSSGVEVLDKDGNGMEILVTPIMVNDKGETTILSPNELWAYVDNVLSGADDLLAADTKGLVISVGVDYDAGEELHLMQQKYYEKKVDLADKSANKIRAINKEIADETDRTILGDFQKRLDNSLKNAQSIIAQLQILDDERNKLQGNDEVTVRMRQIVNTEQEKVGQRAADEYQKALDDYYDYLDSKVKAHIRYCDEIQRLEDELDNVTNPAQKRVIELKIATLNINQDIQDDINYDALLQDFADYEQKKNDITADYDEKRRIATKKGDTKMIEDLNKAQIKALSKLASESIVNSDAWKKLFEKAETMTLKEIDKIIDEINNKTLELKTDITDEELENINKELKKLRETVANKNPFTALKDAMKQFAEDGNFSHLIDAYYIVKSIADSFSQIVSSIKELAEVTGSRKFKDVVSLLTDAMDNISKSFTTFTSGAQSTGSFYAGLIMGIFEGIVDLIAKIMRRIDEKQEERVTRHFAAVTRLQTAYKQLAWEIDKALNFDKYDKSTKQIENLRKKQEELQAALNAENDKRKKKQDDQRKAELEGEIEDIGRQIQDIINDLSVGILGGSIQDICDQLGDALFDAFAAGEDAAEAWGKKVDDIVGNIIKKMIMQKAIEPIIGGIIEKYTNTWFDKDGNFAGWDTVMAGISSLGEDLKGAAPDIISFFDNLPDELKKYFMPDGDGPLASLSGAIKGASQESIDLLAGQTNAVRINQMESIELLRQMLFHLAIIANNTTGANELLKQIEQNTQYSDPLRPYGG